VTHSELISILRNPWGHDLEKMRLDAAALIEILEAQGIAIAEQSARNKSRAEKAESERNAFRKVAQAALDAINDKSPGIAVDILRAALAQPEPTQEDKWYACRVNPQYTGPSQCRFGTIGCTLPEHEIGEKATYESVDL
jgi:hypothetical protein